MSVHYLNLRGRELHGRFGFTENEYIYVLRFMSEDVTIPVAHMYCISLHPNHFVDIPTEVSAYCTIVIRCRLDG